LRCRESLVQNPQRSMPRTLNSRNSMVRDQHLRAPFWASAEYSTRMNFLMMAVITTCGSTMLGWKKAPSEISGARERQQKNWKKRRGVSGRSTKERYHRFPQGKRSVIGGVTSSSGLNMRCSRRLRQRCPFFDTSMACILKGRWPCSGLWPNATNLSNSDQLDSSQAVHICEAVDYVRPIRGTTVGLVCCQKNHGNGHWHVPERSIIQRVYPTRVRRAFLTC
jgi:hypothetical protein